MPLHVGYHFLLVFFFVMIFMICLLARCVNFGRELCSIFESVSFFFFFFFGQYFSCFVSKVNKWNKKRDCYEKVVYVIFVGPVIWFIFCTFFFSFQLFAFLVSSSWQWESNRGTLYSHPNNAHNFQCVGKAAWHGYSHCLNASNFFSNPSSRFQLFCICFERCVVSDLLKFLLITKAHTKNSHPAFGHSELH